MEPHHPLQGRASRADMRRAFSSKFCMVIEVVRAIILGLKTFLGPINSFGAMGRRKFS